MLFNINIIQKSFLIFFKNNDENNNNNNLDLNLDWYLMPNPSSSQIPNPRDFLCFVVGVIVSFKFIFWPQHFITSLKARQCRCFFSYLNPKVVHAHNTLEHHQSRENSSVYHTTLQCWPRPTTSLPHSFLWTLLKSSQSPTHNINTCKLARRGWWVKETPNLQKEQNPQRVRSR